MYAANRVRARLGPSPEGASSLCEVFGEIAVMGARPSSAPPLEERRRFVTRRETPSSCGPEEATEESGDDALGIAALPPRPLPPSTMQAF